MNFSYCFSLLDFEYSIFKLLEFLVIGIFSYWNSFIDLNFNYACGAMLEQSSAPSGNHGFPGFSGENHCVGFTLVHWLVIYNGYFVFLF